MRTLVTRASLNCETLAAVSLAAALLIGAALPVMAQTNLFDPAPLGGGAESRLTQRTAAPAAAAVPRANVNAAGRYAPLREGKDTGCMITLDANARGPGGASKAQLAPACRDQGLVIFDPVGWQMDRGRLALTARKGHRVLFDRQPDGIWLRDPKEGKPLSLRPI